MPIRLSMASVRADDYGAAAVDLEMLRRLIEQRCPTVRFAGYGARSAVAGEYTFRLGPDPARAIVRAPVTQMGNQRYRYPGSWQIKFTKSAKAKAPWRPAHSIHQVVEMVCAASQY